MIRLLTACLVVLVAGPVVAQEKSAGDTVRGFYTPTIWNPLELESFSGVAEPALSVLRKNAEISARSGETGCIDFVVTIDGQDYDEAEIAKTLKIEDKSEAKNGSHEVVARFNLFEEAREIVWTMRVEDSVWKVADVQSPRGGWRLSEFPCP